MSYGTARLDTLDAVTRLNDPEFTLDPEARDEPLPFRLDVVVDGALDESWEFDAEDWERVMHAVLAHVEAKTQRTRPITVSVYDPNAEPPELIDEAEYDPADDEAPGAQHLKLELTLEGAAFEDAGTDEVARLLEVAAARVRSGVTDSALLDYNGNVVGRFTID